MLLSRSARHSYRALRISTRRAFSDATPATYPPLVRALPFAFSAEEAMVRLGVTASSRSIGKNMLGSIGAKYLPWLGFEPIRPSKIQALYLPSWIIVGEVQAEGWLKSDRESELSATKALGVAMFDESFMPGFIFEPLSRFAFLPEGVEKSQYVPFDESLLRAHGSEVLALPFTHTPFSLVDAAQSLSFKQATISEKFGFNPSTVKANFCAAYPVAIPVYLVQYEVDLQPASEAVHTFTAILEAYQPQRRASRFVMEEIQPEIVKQLISEMPAEPSQWVKSATKLLPQSGFLPYGGLDPAFTRHFARGETIMLTLPFSDKSSELNRWIDRATRRQGTLKAYCDRDCAQHTGADVDWSDMRIRPYTHDETAANSSWVRYCLFNTLAWNSAPIVDAQLKKRGIEGDGNGSPGTLGPRFAGGTPEKQAEFSKKALERGGIVAFEPSWYTEWRQLQGGGDSAPAK